MNKKHLFFNRTICDQEDLMIFFFFKFKLSWDKQQMINKYVGHYYFNKMYYVACFLMKMINQ